jgi:hypothetical protein
MPGAQAGSRIQRLIDVAGPGQLRGADVVK